MNSNTELNFRILLTIKDIKFCTYIRRCWTTPHWVLLPGDVLTCGASVSSGGHTQRAALTPYTCADGKVFYPWGGPVTLRPSLTDADGKPILPQNVPVATVSGKISCVALHSKKKSFH